MNIGARAPPPVLFEQPRMINPHPTGAWPLPEAILRTLLYADVFDFPLTAAEIYRFLVGYECEPRELISALDCSRLLDAVEVDPPYYFLAGKSYSAHVRRHYLPELRRKWARAQVYARLLQSVPFLRGAFVTGSLAAGNIDGHSDVDFLLIAQPGRLLLCHAWIKLVFRRGLGGAARVFAGDYFDWMCPNFILGEDDLELPRHDLYTAWEATQAVPIFGQDVCRRFLAANTWITEYLPNSRTEERRPGPSDAAVQSSQARLPRAAGRLVEAALPGPAARRIDRGLQALLKRRHAARSTRPDPCACDGLTPDLAQAESERPAARWEMFPVTTRFRILEAYHYRLRSFGLEPVTALRPEAVATGG